MSRSRWRAALFLLPAAVVALDVACGNTVEIAPDEVVLTPDGGADQSAPQADGSVDAPVAIIDGGEAGRCSDNATFGMPEKISVLSTGGVEEQWPRLTSDETMILFGRASPHIYSFYIARRAKITDAWGQSARLMELEGPQNDLDPMLTGDGLSIYFASTRGPDATAHSDIFVANRSDASASFGVPVMVSPVDTDGDEFQPFYSEALEELWFTYDEGSLTRRIYKAKSVGNGSFGPKTRVEELPVQAGNATLSSDGLTIYISAPKVVSGTDRDIFVARRADKMATFSTPVPVANVNTSDKGEEPGFISPDGCRLYFHRVGASGDADLYLATKPQPL